MIICSRELTHSLLPIPVSRTTTDSPDSRPFLPRLEFPFIESLDSSNSLPNSWRENTTWDHSFILLLEIIKGKREKGEEGLKMKAIRFFYTWRWINTCCAELLWMAVAYMKTRAFISRLPLSQHLCYRFYFECFSSCFCYKRNAQIMIQNRISSITDCI